MTLTTAKHIHRRFRLMLGLGLLALGLGACSSDELPQPGKEPVQENAISLGFYINVSDGVNPASDMSRATPTDGEYHPGSGYENFIDIEGGDFAIYFFDKDNKYIAPFANPSLERLDITNSPSSKTYVARTKIESDELFNQITTGPTKIVMLANWRGQYPDINTLEPGVTTISDLVDAATIEYGSDPWGAIIDYEHRIPLYGVMQFPGVSLIPVMLNLTGVDLHLLRAFAKVEVYQGPETLADLESVTLTRHNTKAFCAPHGVYHQDQYVKGSYFGDYTDSPSIPEGVMSNDELPLPFYTDTRDNLKHFIIYIPEFKNIDEIHGSQAQLNVTFAGSDMPREVEFKYYNVPDNLKDKVKEGDYFNIMRNYWYQFVVSKKTDDDIELEVEVDVQPYANCEITVDLGLQRDKDGHLKIYLEKDGSLPANLKAYLDAYGKKLPENLKYEPDLGDYYALIPSPDGKMENAEIWLKDIEGYRVIDNFSDNNFFGDNTCHSNSCSTRLVQLTGSISLGSNIFRKDRYNDRILQHNDDHSLIAYAPDGTLVYKPAADHNTRYPVESWSGDCEWNSKENKFDETRGNFYIEYTDRYVEYAPTGKETGNVVMK